jgi:putative Holliday junction resolvase
MEKIACIDVGLKRIGLATSILNIVTPQQPILRINRNQAANEVSIFLKNNNITKLIVGFPSNTERQTRIQHFVSLLDFDGKIIFVNEDYTSIEAENLTKGIFKHKKDGKNDSIAAMLILQRYLDSK